MNGLRQYQSVSRQTGIVDADPHKLIEMLYAGALERINMAKSRMQANDYEGKGRLITKAIEIVGGLRLFLNKEQGGEVAETLERLYEYMEYRLFEANLKNDTAMLDEVAAHLRQVKEGWDGIREQVVQEGLV